MKLSKMDADLYNDLMWSLQHYVNQKLDIIPDVEDILDFQLLMTKDKFKIRNALYDNIDLIDSYLADNPQDLANKDLKVIKGWKNFVKGSFVIERQLKKHAIFIGGEKVYAVFALQDTFDELLPGLKLPIYVDTVLLPFKGRIIYDGLMQGYSLFFGGGIKFDLKETYMAAKQKGEIIVSFDPQIQSKEKVRKSKPIKDWKPTIIELSQQAKPLRSTGGAPAVHSPAFSLVKASIDFARLAVEEPDNVDQLWKALEKVSRILYRAEDAVMRGR